MLSQKWVEMPLQDDAGHCPEYVDRIHSPSFLAAYSILCVINGYGQGLEASSSEINGDRVTQYAKAVYLHPPSECGRNVRSYGHWYPVAGTGIWVKIILWLVCDKHYQLKRKDFKHHDQKAQKSNSQALGGERPEGYGLPRGGPSIFCRKMTVIVTDYEGIPKEHMFIWYPNYAMEKLPAHLEVPSAGRRERNLPALVTPLRPAQSARH